MYLNSTFGTIVASNVNVLKTLGMSKNQHLRLGKIQIRKLKYIFVELEPLYELYEL